MANKTDVLARNVHGTNPQYLIEKILRSKIYDSRFWKEHCFALTGTAVVLRAILFVIFSLPCTYTPHTAESLVDIAVDLDAVGGAYGGSLKPTKFMVL
jgi:pre-mRNA-splicing factor 38A